MVLHANTEPMHDYSNDAFSEKLHSMFERINISPDEAIIVGGQVLAAYGMRPAKDLDVLVGPQTFEAIHKDGHIPADITAGFRHGERRPGVVSLGWNDDGSGVDTWERKDHKVEVICTYEQFSSVSIAEAQQEFDERVRNQTITINGLHFTTLEDVVLHMKAAPHDIYDDRGSVSKKTKNDLSLIRAFVTSDDQNSSHALLQLDAETATNVSELLNKSLFRKIARGIFRR